MMRKGFVVCAFVVALAVVLSAQDKKAVVQDKKPAAQDKASVTLSGYLIDNMCAAGQQAESEDIVEEVRNHAVSCALMQACVKSGFAVVVPEDGKVYKLDEKGNKSALQLLRDTRVKQGMFVQVEGTLEGETLRVLKIVQAQDKTTL